ncbi:hypothetical protein [Botrimarina mediterranea]|uniref:hypothetical protein n=1 Tax=Botrimarina mediterranea TaxID=2528022 RepID=UPI0011A30719|nr:hypothetical protein [Botrimarina mediterranea]
MHDEKLIRRVLSAEPSRLAEAIEQVRRVTIDAPHTTNDAVLTAAAQIVIADAISRASLLLRDALVVNRND